MKRSLKQKIALTSLILGIIVVFASAILIIAANHSVKKMCKEKCYDSVESMPHRKLAVVLGTAPMLSNGQVNLYFKYRMEAAALLFHTGKIDYILVSGDNSRKDYDEVSIMKETLVKLGVPSDKIYKDHAGFRTLDSIVRAKEVFGETELVVVSQQFHNARALYLAKGYGMNNVIAYNANDVSKYYGFKTQIREKLARVKAVLDVHLFKTQPKFLGEPIKIE